MCDVAAMPRPLGTRSENSAGRASRVGALVRAGLSVPAGFVVGAKESLDALLLAHQVDEAGGFPMLVRGDSGSAVATSGVELEQAITRCRTSGGEVLVQQRFTVDQVGTAESIDREAGDDDIAVAELAVLDGTTPATAASKTSKVRIRRPEGVVTARILVDARANLSDRLAAEIARVLTKLHDAVGHPVSIEWATDDEGRLWLLDFHRVAPPNPPAGWVAIPVPAPPRARALWVAAFAPLVSAALISETPALHSCNGRIVWNAKAWPPKERVGPVGTLHRSRLRRALDAHIRDLGTFESAILASIRDPAVLTPDEFSAWVGELDARWTYICSGLLLFTLCEGGEFAPRATAVIFEALSVVVSVPAPPKVQIPEITAASGASALPEKRGWLGGLGFGTRRDAKAEFTSMVALVGLAAGVVSIAYAESCRRNPTAPRPNAPSKAPTGKPLRRPGSS